MPTNLEPGEISVERSERNIDHNIDRLSHSVDELADKLELPALKIQSMKRNLKKIQDSPWGLIAVGSAFFIGFMTTRKMR